MLLLCFPSFGHDSGVRDTGYVLRFQELRGQRALNVVSWLVPAPQSGSDLPSKDSVL